MKTVGVSQKCPKQESVIKKPVFTRFTEVRTVAKFADKASATQGLGRHTYNKT